MAPRSGLIDMALVALILGDTGSPNGLMQLLPDGVFWDEAPRGAKRFVIVSLIDEADEATFDGRAIEDALYLVKGVARADLGVNMFDVESRIDELLEEARLTAGSPLEELEGYHCMAVFRESRFPRHTEPDDLNPAIRWHHRGGQYRVQMSVNVGTSP